MATPDLTPRPDEAAETPGERAERCLAEARAAARENVALLSEALAATAEAAAQIIDGGAIYPSPLRYHCRLICEEASIRRSALLALAAKSFPEPRR